MIKKELIAHRDPKSPVSETFRTLRTNIQFMNSNKKLETLLVTSTMPGEGKSWVASNLAVTFAQAGKRVILIDADMRKGRQYSIFGILPRPGLSNYLSGMEDGENSMHWSEYIRTLEIPNLCVMPAGSIPPNPSELLVTTRMLDLIEDLKKQCDLIIIDSTPSKLVTDSVILSRIVDSTIVVTAHNQTQKDDLEKVVRDIKNVGGNIAGIVYNKIPVSAKKCNDTYYYASTSKSSRTKMDYKYDAKMDEQVNMAIEMINKEREMKEKNDTK